ncbi:MAG: hypothetical protein DRP74_03335 [Candidatus Omnitrophota bacterium]|nr:MAG: hypothetical protein DRP74_03335 [Candidatus Omnitrophota bacterium]
MKKILIIGAGFAGMSALSKLCAYKKDLDITLIEQSKKASFLPLLPDVLGRGLDSVYLSVDLESLSRNMNFKFIRAKTEK